MRRVRKERLKPLSCMRDAHSQAEHHVTGLLFISRRLDEERKKREAKDQRDREEAQAGHAHYHCY